MKLGSGVLPVNNSGNTVVSTTNVRIDLVFMRPARAKTWARLRPEPGLPIAFQPATVTGDCGAL
jgi:hypothetical protein